MDSLESLIGVIQGVRETVRAYRDELGCGDLFMACFSLEKVEEELFERLDGEELTLQRDVKMDVVVP